MPLLMSSSINLIHPSDFSETKYIASLLRMPFKGDKAIFNQMIHSPRLYLNVIQHFQLTRTILRSLFQCYICISVRRINYIKSRFV